MNIYKGAEQVGMNLMGVADGFLHSAPIISWLGFTRGSQAQYLGPASSEGTSGFANREMAGEALNEKSFQDHATSPTPGDDIP